MSKKNSVAHAQISRVYTLAKILSKIFVKTEGALGTLFTIIV